MIEILWGSVQTLGDEVFYREGCTIKRTLRTIDRLTAKQALAAENASPPS